MNRSDNVHIFSNIKKYVVVPNIYPGDSRIKVIKYLTLCHLLEQVFIRFMDFSDPLSFGHQKVLVSTVLEKLNYHKSTPLPVGMRT